MFYKETIKKLKQAIDEAKKEIEQLEQKTKDKWESNTKRIETCEKANEMFIQALNEQRNVIAKIIKYLNGNQTKTTKKKGK